jgi:hypothetical protein
MKDVQILSNNQTIARLSGPQEGKQMGLQSHETMMAEREVVRPLEQITLRQAWARYRTAHLVRKGRSQRTIDGYRDHVERLFAGWLDLPLQELGMDPGKVVMRHDDITEEHGPYIANSSMRTLLAIYKHARRTHRSLPADNPVDAVDWNAVKRRCGSSMALKATSRPSSRCGFLAPACRPSSAAVPVFTVF